MYINIELEQKVPSEEPPKSPKFNIEIVELLDAIEKCYTQLGTPYDPIRIDNFVTVGENAFSTIDKETKVSVSLEELDADKVNSSIIIDHKLVCCKVKIVDKKFINSGHIADSTHWGKIFEPNADLMYSAPDGTLYVSPNKEGKCVVSTIKTGEDCNVSYSILIALKIRFKDKKPRKFYLILDPLVKVSSSEGTNPTY